MAKEFSVSDIIWRKVQSKLGHHPYYIHICPDCEDHKPSEKNYKDGKFGREEIDCKNTFFHTDKNGVMSTMGQCCCYSLDHK